MDVAINIGGLEIHIKGNSSLANQNWRGLIRSESIQVSDEALEVIRVVGG